MYTVTVINRAIYSYVPRNRMFVVLRFNPVYIIVSLCNQRFNESPSKIV